MTTRGTVDNKQERRKMKIKGVEGLPADLQESLAANEEFADIAEGDERVLHTHSGWDPYEVWRTRVKGTSGIKEHEADPRR